MPYYQHTLCIGGTGMLQAASIQLAAKTGQLTSVARTRASLNRLDEALDKSFVVHHQLQLDWSRPTEFLNELENHATRTQPPDLVAAWIHGSELPLNFALRLAELDQPFRFFHIIGSASENPLRIAERIMDEFDPPRLIDYCQVILGAKRSGGKTRWLTDQEISNGVLEAIDQGNKRFIVGTLEPFESY